MKTRGVLGILVLQLVLLLAGIVKTSPTGGNSDANKAHRATLDLKLEWPALRKSPGVSSKSPVEKKDELLSSPQFRSGDDEPDPNAIHPTVATPLGQLVGKMMQSRNGRYYYAYLGIPYTQKTQRFQPSVLVESFEGKFLDARKEGSMCPQPGSSSEVLGDENCLFLNIYYPHTDLCRNVSESGKLPVMYNIHGGSYTTGYGAYFDPKYLMDECIVFVSVNYRLGALGFLTLEDGLIPGNLGLKDQVVGLQFVNKYITHFRGDANSVTILGISAGGSSVSHLVTSPTTKGLIHRAIAQSGNVMNPWSITENPGEYSRALGRILNCSTETTAALKQCLQEADMKDIVLKQGSTGAILPFTPVVEVAGAKDPFQDQNPAVRYRNGDFNRIPIIAGFVQDEGIGLFAAGVLNSPNLLYMMNHQWNSAAPAICLYEQLGFSEEKKNNISSKIRNFYFGDAEIGPETRQNLTDLFSDRLFVQGTFETVELHSKFAPAYPYVLSYKGGSSFAWTHGYQIPATTHGDDAQWLFTYKDFGYGTEPFQFSRNMVKLWTSFAITGRPTGLESTGDSWKASKGRANDIWFDLDLPTRNIANYLEPRRHFWQNVGIYDTEHY